MLVGEVALGATLDVWFAKWSDVPGEEVFPVGALAAVIDAV